MAADDLDAVFAEATVAFCLARDLQIETQLAEMKSVRLELEAERTRLRNEVIAKMAADGVVSQRVGVGNRWAKVTVADGARRVVVHDETLVPPAYFTPKVDTDKVRQSLVKDGLPVPGVVLETGAPSLRVKWED